MKKIISILLVAAMVLCLAACGSSNAPASSAAPAASSEAAAPAESSGETDWPTTTVSVILPYKAGGDTDTYCRALFQRVGDNMGQTFVITNEEGGSGMVAAMDVMNKPNDGYTLLFCHTGASLVQMATNTCDFSYIDDFESVATVAMDSTYALMAVSKDGQYSQYSRGWENLEDMIADAKANPGVLRYSTVYGSTTEYVGRRVESECGVEFDNIDVGTSTGDRLAALLGGQIELVAVNYMNIADYVEAGDLICLGIMSKDHIDAIDCPTFTEQGYDVVNAKKYEVKFPKGTDAAIINKLAAEIENVVVNDASYAEAVEAFYAQPYWRDAATMDAEDAAEVEELAAFMG